MAKNIPFNVETVLGDGDSEVTELLMAGLSLHHDIYLVISIPRGQICNDLRRGINSSQVCCSSRDI